MAKQKPLPKVEPAMEKMKENFPGSIDQLIPMLQFAQNELGCLPTEAMVGIADYLKIPPSHVYGVATFYAQFRFTPLGENIITVCRGTACHVRSGQRVIEEIIKELRIDPGETTKDLMFSLETVACVGSCALAPVVVVNKKVHGKVTPKKMKSVLDQLRGIEPEVGSEKKAGKEGKEKAPAKTSKDKEAAPEKKKDEKTAAKKPAKKSAKKAKPKKAAKKAAKKKTVMKKAKRTGAGKSGKRAARRKSR